MTRLIAAIAALPATLLLVLPAGAHHSQAMFDPSKEIIVEGTVARFLRSGDESIFCAFNLGDEPATVSLPEGQWAQIGTDLGGQAPLASLTLAPWAFVLAKRI